ncbi:MAG: tripartite tricarboxylate transporter substrate binding protein [Alkalispirochaeta sp.]
MNTTLTRRSRVIVLVVAALVLIAAHATASGQAEDSFPTRAISYVIPFNPGGQSDVTAQYQKQYLEDALGVNVVIRHQPGAGGALAWSNLVKARPDGYTVTGNNVPHIIIQPMVRENAGFETEELKPVYLFQSTPIGLAVDPDSPFDSLQDLLDYAADNPGEITVSGSGTHSGHHLALLQMQYLTDTEFTYIPATGAAPSVAAFLGGHTDALLANSTDLLSHSGDMKVLAIGTEQRFQALPDVPTFIEEGLEMTAGIDRGVAVPPETPDEIVATLEEAFDQVSANEEFVTEMEELGFVIHAIGATEFATYLDRKTEEIGTVLRELGEI